MEKNFLEKYRPKNVSELVGNKKTIERIFSQAKNNKLVNMIFVGKPGNGKTSTASILTKKIIRKSTDKIIINCSDKTGVEYIRKHIIEVARLQPTGDLRIFVLEESDELSVQAQDALRKPMEQPFDKNNRFIYLCNNLNKITPALRDRCRIYRFMPIEPEEIVKRLKYIRECEKIDISDELLFKLAKMSNGSVRFPIIRLEELSSLNKKIIEDDIKFEENLEVIKEVFLMLKNKKLIHAKNSIMELYQDGLYFDDIIELFHNYTISSMNIEEDKNYEMKLLTLIKIAEAEKSVKEGCNEFIQLSSLLSTITMVLNKR